MGVIAERVSPGNHEHGIAGNGPTNCVSYELQLPCLAPHGRHYNFLSFADYAVREEEPQGGKIGLNGEVGDSASL
ncbi:MAG: hypothetical protein IMF02_12170 [Proteobacteria bacterium]|nr:hypothetical protein [Pseudomonadota bacterium]